MPTYYFNADGTCYSLNTSSMVAPVPPGSKVIGSIPNLFSDCEQCCDPPVATVGECLQLGTSGLFVADGIGVLRLWLNDDFFGDNSGSVTVTFTPGGGTYIVPAADSDGVLGPIVTVGQVYNYSASGSWTYPLTGGPDGNPGAGPAHSGFTCPGLVRWSLVAKVQPV
ncbi:MAG: hypothetical protein HC888_00045 [Candidatus Competibacteraceae bacterium]|nr:hypothetical protein [Candidatus Competibacteraceae bacterium]